MRSITTLMTACLFLVSCIVAKEAAASNTGFSSDIATFAENELSASNAAFDQGSDKSETIKSSDTSSSPTKKTKSKKSKKVKSGSKTKKVKKGSKKSKKRSKSTAGTTDSSF